MHPLHLAAWAVRIVTPVHSQIVLQCQRLTNISVGVQYTKTETKEINAYLEVDNLIATDVQFAVIAAPKNREELYWISVERSSIKMSIFLRSYKRLFVQNYLYICGYMCTPTIIALIFHEYKKICTCHDFNVVTI